MFESLTQRLTKIFKNLVNKAKLNDANMNETLSEIKKALLEADVSYPVIKRFLKEFKEEAHGIVISQGLNPAQMVIKLVSDKLTQMMGAQCSELDLRSQPPAVILMAGLQGSGKTTSSAKLAKWLIERQKKSVMLVSVDIYRPAAIEQLQRLASEVGADFFDKADLQDPVAIAKAALMAARTQHKDVLIIDTAGRLHIDEKMMEEIKDLNQAMDPIETLLVVDAMTGQEAANVAKAFHDTIALTGVIVSKIEGDARGGAVLSIHQVTGVPIKFMGVGEKVEALEAFYPDRMASRILGMGDVLSLVEDLSRSVNKEEAEKLAKKLEKGHGFDLEDFRSQIIQMNSMGGMAKIMGMLPGMAAAIPAANQQVGDKMMNQMLVIINSMTQAERRSPLSINGSRKNRIARGSGTKITDVNKVIKQYETMGKMMKKFKPGSGIMDKLRSLQSKSPGDF